jgi:hypothetical protein
MQYSTGAKKSLKNGEGGVIYWMIVIPELVIRRLKVGTHPSSSFFPCRVKSVWESDRTPPTHRFRLFAPGWLNFTPNFVHRNRVLFGFQLRTMVSNARAHLQRTLRGVKLLMGLEYERDRGREVRKDRQITGAEVQRANKT